VWDTSWHERSVFWSLDVAISSMMRSWISRGNGRAMMVYDEEKKDGVLDGVGAFEETCHVMVRLGSTALDNGVCWDVGHGPGNDELG